MFTYDPSTDAGKVRMLCCDRDSTYQIFQDAEIEAFLELEDGSVYRAAAMALDTLASNEALTLKVIETLDLKTNGAQTAAALRKGAESLREREAESGYVAIAGMVTDYGGFAGREAWLRQYIMGTG